MGMGDGGKSTQRKAERTEAERQDRIARTQSDINAIYDNPERAAQIEGYGGSLFDYLKGDLDRQSTDASRNSKFALARSGLTGGSRQVDVGRTMGEEYQRGLGGITSRVEGAKADLRGADESARLNLIQLANQGLSGTEAYTRATQAMQQALQGQRASDTAQGIGDIFGSVLTAKSASEERKAKQRADDLYASMYTPLYGGGR